MMEEASDEQPEMVSHEEAMQAEKEAKAASSPVAPSVPVLDAPSPLPAFLTKERSTSPPVMPAPKSSSPSPPLRSPVQSAAPEAPKSPHVDQGSPEPEQESNKPQARSQGLFGWIAGNSLVRQVAENSYVSRVVEKTKSSMESVITTLDPGMRGVMYSGGDIEIALTSTKENKLLPVREAFQTIFGKATVSGKATQATTAAQPVGFTAGLKGAEERISHLRKSGTIPDGQTIVSVEGFIVEILPDRWYEMSCLVLKDPSHRIELQTFSQPTLVPTEYVLKAQDKTPSDYPLKWAGLAVTIGEVVEESQPHIGHADWQMVLSGVSRRDSLLLAAKSLAYMYKERLPTSFVS